ncbi:4-phosphoerythronate dehydrogenase [Simiduia agarivorans]|uniref:Erythronate-4-phosphate dehydrogenase n=1 Tax=Simiduia agarivorans (strain DSM 21679 / JCM 13881 / BCRC 17597 / SA1) TaxID=1117647 RepID=K4KVR9_SIMAS|nr:4-phosphoerythronate dehydrogenase [Simiduia agarivorans]AFU98037.1 erythronate-4-phosphate dehydrogenase [Simiduia agarivorans SA1 = DSM 21679]
MNDKKRILVDENVPDAEHWFGRLGEVRRFKGRELQADALRDADALIVRSVTQVNEALLAESRLDFVGTCTIGCDHVDQALLERRGIGFSNAPGCNANSVVEYVFAALAQLNVNFTTSAFGIVGAGNVGGRLLDRCTALGISACAYDPLLDQQDSRLVSLAEVFAQPIVCMHAPLTRDGVFPTYHMIGEELLDRLPESAVLISAGRGPVIDNALLLAFKRRRPDVLLVLDVWEYEPWVDPHLLHLAEIGSPHIAGYSLDGKLAGTRMVFQAMCRHWSMAEWADSEQFDAANATGPLPPLSPGDWADVREQLLSAYPIADDDARLRAMVAQAGNETEIKQGFDQLRRSYPERREFRFHPLPACGLSDAARQWLHLFGFGQLG